MPEGDTIFRTARSMGRALVGKPITGFRSNYPLLTRFHDDTPITGQTVERVESRGKWLLIHLSGGATLVTHMLMNGSWHLYRTGDRWRRPARDMRIVLENCDYQAVAFAVPVARIYTAQALAREKRIPPPGSDVLSEDFDPVAAAVRLRSFSSRRNRRRAFAPAGAGRGRECLQIGDLLCRRSESVLSCFSIER